MELGTLNLAFIDKGGRVIQKESGSTNQYLNGDGEWTNMPSGTLPEVPNEDGERVLTATTSGSGESKILSWEIASSGGGGDLPQLPLGSLLVGAGVDTPMSEFTKGSALQTLRIDSNGSTLEWFTPPFLDGDGLNSTISRFTFKENVKGANAIAFGESSYAGLRSGDLAKPYVFWKVFVTRAITINSILCKGSEITPGQTLTYIHGGIKYNVTNSTGRIQGIVVINNPYIITTLTSPTNRCRLLTNTNSKITDHLTIYSIRDLGSGNFEIILSTTRISLDTSINWTDDCSIYIATKGTSSLTDGNYSIALGFSSVAAGRYSISSNSNTITSGYSGIALGQFSVVIGNSGIATGTYSMAVGNDSIALGNHSLSLGHRSFAFGQYTIASGQDQTVFGKFNTTDTTSAFIIGAGSDENNRLNIFSINWSGDITCGAINSTSIESTTLTGRLTLASTADILSTTLAGDNRIAYFTSDGILTTSANYTLSTFAASTHNHDDVYAPISQVGRARSFSNLSDSGTVTISAGNDALVYFETATTGAYTITLPNTNMASRAGDTIQVVDSSAGKITFSTGAGNLLIKPALHDAGANSTFTISQSLAGVYTFVCDGTYWRVYFEAGLLYS